MQRTARLPDDTKLVLPAQRGRAVREHAPTIAIFAVTATIAGLGVATTGSVVWAVIGALCVAGVVLELLLVHAQLGFGPVLAADSDHVWVRAGGFAAPRSVQLTWPEITAVTLHLWHGRRGATARYLSFDLTAEAMTELNADPHLANRARRLARTFGSPLALAEQRERDFDAVLRELRDLAPESVRFTQKT